jgi:hypothetical protein
LKFYLYLNLQFLYAPIFTNNATLLCKHGQFFTLPTKLTLPHTPSTRNPSTNLLRTPQRPLNPCLPNTQRRIPHSPFLPRCSRYPLSTSNMPSNVRYPSLTSFAYPISRCPDITKPLRRFIHTTNSSSQPQPPSVNSLDSPPKTWEVSGTSNSHSHTLTYRASLLCLTSCRLLPQKISSIHYSRKTSPGSNPGRFSRV